MVPDPFTSALHAVGKRIISSAVLGTRLVITAVSVVRSAACPTCGRCSRKRHGRYWRRPAACPCFGAPVTLEIELRRFRCRNRRCPRRTFAEPWCLTSLGTPSAGCRPGVRRAGSSALTVAHRRTRSRQAPARSTRGRPPRRSRQHLSFASTLLPPWTMPTTRSIRPPRPTGPAPPRTCEACELIFG